MTFDQRVKNPNATAAIIGLILVILMFACAAFAGQTEPDKKRTAQIQTALVEHGYAVHVTGKWDAETKTMLKQIALDHCWQGAHVPDARVLRLLGFKTLAYDPLMEDPATVQGPNHLDPQKCGGTFVQEN